MLNLKKREKKEKKEKKYAKSIDQKMKLITNSSTAGMAMYVPHALSCVEIAGSYLR
jgi:hypothetical protein